MMNITLIDKNKHITDSWQAVFEGYKNIEIYNGDLETYLESGVEVDSIASPGNSLGLMDDGFDGAVSRHFGPDLHKAVQEALLDEYYGEQPIGTCLKIPIPNSNVVLLHSPSMRTPEVIIDIRVIYSCTRSTLVVALKNNLKRLIMPAFGGFTGCVLPIYIAKYMEKAFYDLFIIRGGKRRYNTWDNILEI